MPPQQLLSAVTATLSADLLVAPAQVRRLIERHAVQARRSRAGTASTSTLTDREVEGSGTSPRVSATRRSPST
ncbi:MULTISPECIES: hypothetical protein [unclassified Streptomyces]|uniref:hypothetical protein n=1 Tax=unclassified Streptomyces TaxID=2593676 RepID=UPI0003A3E157|nr:hypothetical protein [Streptomyces sp. 303MFCol5.2]